MAEKTKGEEFEILGEDVVQKLKELVSQGIVRKIIVRNREGQTLIEVPLVVGLGGIALFPVWGAIGAAVALTAGCTIFVEKEEKK